MIQQAQAELPNECCGLLAGTIDTTGPQPLARVAFRYPLVNEAASPREFISEPYSMFSAERDRKERGLEFVAVYHSHPLSAPIPSRTDLERNYSPDVMNLIISLEQETPSVRAWWLTDTDYCEAEWEIVAADGA
jgi:proteasome lid subunit RPN8/RPN11